MKSGPFTAPVGHPPTKCSGTPNVCQKASRHSSSGSLTALLEFRFILDIFEVEPNEKLRWTGYILISYDVGMDHMQELTPGASTPAFTTYQCSGITKSMLVCRRCLANCSTHRRILHSCFAFPRIANACSSFLYGLSDDQIDLTYQ